MECHLFCHNELPSALVGLTFFTAFVMTPMRIYWRRFRARVGR